MQSKYNSKTLVSVAEHCYRENFECKPMKAIVKGYDEKKVISSKDIIRKRLKWSDEKAFF